MASFRIHGNLSLRSSRKWYQGRPATPRRQFLRSSKFIRRLCLLLHVPPQPPLSGDPHQQEAQHQLVDSVRFSTRSNVLYLAGVHRDLRLQ